MAKFEKYLDHHGNLLSGFPALRPQLAGEARVSSTAKLYTHPGRTGPPPDHQGVHHCGTNGDDREGCDHFTHHIGITLLK